MSTSAVADDPPPPEPAPPQDWECCGNGCEPCIFDLHAQAVQDWREQMATWRARQALRDNPQAVSTGGTGA